MDNGGGNRREKQRVKVLAGGRCKSGMSGNGVRGGGDWGVGEENERQDS